MSIKSAVLVGLEVLNQQGSLVKPRPRRPGSRLLSFAPRLFEARCPDCAAVIAIVTKRQMDITATAPPRHPDAPDAPDDSLDGADAEVEIGRRVSLEPGFVNARTRYPPSGWPWYRRPRSHLSRQCLVIRTPAVVTCKCGCDVYLQATGGEYANADRERRGEIAYREWSEADAREYRERLDEIVRAHRSHDEL